MRCAPAQQILQVQAYRLSPNARCAVRAGKRASERAGKFFYEPAFQKAGRARRMNKIIMEWYCCHRRKAACSFYVVLRGKKKKTDLLSSTLTQQTVTI